jgi:hypothetical protein
VTTADLQQDTFVGIRAVYREKPYALIELGSYFSALENAWRACLELASHNAHVRDAMRAIRQGLIGQEAGYLNDFVAALAERLEQIDMFYRQFEPSEEEEELQRRLHRIWEDSSEQVASELSKIRSRLLESRRHDTISLTVSRLRIESPMELTLAVIHGTGVTGLVAYSVHLLVHVMRDPERVGAWLPRLVAGWHKGMTEVEEARQDHADAESERKRRRAIEDASNRMIAAAEKIKELPAAEATAIGAGDTPDDIVAALSE